MTAVARTLAVLAWHLLSREQDYAFARPALTQSKLRKLERMAGVSPAARMKRGQRATASAEREASLAAEAAYRRLVKDWRATRPANGKGGRGRDTGARIS